MSSFLSNLKGQFNDKPTRRILIVGLGVMGFIFIFLIYNFFLKDDSTPADLTEAVRPPAVDGTPGGIIQKTNENYRNVLRQDNLQRLKEAEQNGTSSMLTIDVAPEPVEKGESLKAIDQPSAMVPVKITNPDPQPIVVPRQSAPPVTHQAQPVDQQRQERVRKLAEDMTSTIALWRVSKAVAGQEVTPKETDVAQTDGGTDAPGGGAGGDEVLIASAGDFAYVRNALVVDSDRPGTPVMVEIQSGPLRGAKAFGAAQYMEDVFVVALTRASRSDIGTIQINAVMINPDTWDVGTYDRKDPRALQRYILRAGVEFIAGISSAMAQTASTTTTSTMGTQTTSTSEPTRKEALWEGAARLADTLAEDIGQAADEMRPWVRLDAGTTHGIVFMEDVTMKN